MMLTSSQLQNLRTILEEEKRTFLEQVKEEIPLSERDSTGELSAYDNHPADMGTELFEREKDIALNELAREDIVAIDKALQAMDKGEYGKCAVCKKEIPLERLEAIPTALYCMEHAPAHGMQSDPSVEDITIRSLTARERGEDNEDILQDVMNFGSSDTQADFSTSKELNYNEMFTDSEDTVGYAEDFEDFIGTDIDGKHNTVYNQSKNEHTKNLNIKTLDDLAKESEEDM